MTDKEFKRLKRSDLIEIIYEQQKELEETKAELEKVKWAKARKDIFAALDFARIEIDCMEREARQLQQEIETMRQEMTKLRRQEESSAKEETLIKDGCDVEPQGGEEGQNFQSGSDTSSEQEGSEHNSSAELNTPTKQLAEEQQEDASRSTNKWIQRLRKKKQ